MKYTCAPDMSPVFDNIKDALMFFMGNYHKWNRKYQTLTLTEAEEVWFHAQWPTSSIKINRYTGVV